MNRPLTNTSKNTQTGSPGFRISKFEERGFPGEVNCYDHFTLIWITEGSGKLKTGCTEFDVTEDSLLTFSPLRPFLLVSDQILKGFILQLPTDLISFHQMTGETTVIHALFENTNQAPLVRIDAITKAALGIFITKTEVDTDNNLLAQKDLMAAYLKILLINIYRLKMRKSENSIDQAGCLKEHHLLQRLKTAIESNFRARHAPSAYAEMLCVTTKTLSKISKIHYHKTLSNMINERIVTEAKQQLYLTRKAIKEIAYDLGYEDEYYFSRFFKLNTCLSPKDFREKSAF